jgi:hypothetical protein
MGRRPIFLACLAILVASCVGHVLMGGICALLIPLVYVEVRKGGDWRRRRISALDAKEAEG